MLSSSPGARQHGCAPLAAAAVSVAVAALALASHSSRNSSRQPLLVASAHSLVSAAVEERRAAGQCWPAQGRTGQAWLARRIALGALLPKVYEAGLPPKL